MSEERRGYIADWWADQKDTLRLIRKWWWLALLILLLAGIQAELRFRFESHPTEQPE